jgi:hypothetical protein
MQMLKNGVWSEQWLSTGVSKKYTWHGSNMVLDGFGTDAWSKIVAPVCLQIHSSHLGQNV